MIPKIIHYCWFGGNPLPEDAKKYIESWKKFCPDYQIMEWNESNFDVNQIPYTKEAYDNKKWAFVTDYVRLYALLKYGGVYMDTDVEIIKPLDSFLKEKGFSGFELPNRVPTGIMASEMNHPFIRELLLEYDGKHFIDESGNADLTTNVEQITDIAKKNGLKFNNQEQTICDYTFYPTDVFCPKNNRTMEIHVTENTYTIHHFKGSWNDQKKIRQVLKKNLPSSVLKIMVKIMDLIKIK